MENSSEVVAILERIKEVGLKSGQTLTAPCLFDEHRKCHYKEECDCKCHGEESDDSEAE